MTAPSRAAQPSTGRVSAGFEAVRAELDSYLLGDPGFSAQVAIHHRGELVVDLVGGAELDEDAVTGVYSATKGAAAVVVAQLVDRGILDLDERVVAYWPEFEVHGKGLVTVGQLLSHQAGVLAPEGGFTPRDMTDSEYAAERLAATRPAWAPGSAFGYHGLSVGVFMEELTRRTTGRELKDIFAREVAGPRALDFFIGLPDAQEHRYRRIRPAEPTIDQRAAAETRPWSPYSLRALSLAMLGAPAVDLADVWFSPNVREYRALGHPSSLGVGSARGLAGVYAAALGHLGDPLLDRDTLARVAQQRAWGIDRVLDVATSFATVFMKPMPREDFGSHLAFGHDGGGGAIGFADPAFEMSFGYVALPNQVLIGGAYPGGVLPRPLRLAELARTAISERER